MAMPNNQTYPRLGVVISKKIMRLAVNRNYFKRVVREVFRLNQFKLKGLDLIVRAKKPFPRTESFTATHELVQCFEKIVKCRDS